MEICGDPAVDADRSRFGTLSRGAATTAVLISGFRHLAHEAYMVVLSYGAGDTGAASQDARFHVETTELTLVARLSSIEAPYFRT